MFFRCQRSIKVWIQFLFYYYLPALPFHEIIFSLAINSLDEQLQDEEEVEEVNLDQIHFSKFTQELKAKLGTIIFLIKFHQYPFFH